MVKIHYKGAAGGHDLERSDMLFHKPLEYEVLAKPRKIIECVDWVVPQMSIGEKVLLICPSKYGYG